MHARGQWPADEPLRRRSSFCTIFCLPIRARPPARLLGRPRWRREGARIDSAAALENSAPLGRPHRGAGRSTGRRLIGPAASAPGWPAGGRPGRRSNCQYNDLDLRVKKAAGSSYALGLPWRTLRAEASLVLSSSRPLAQSPVLSFFLSAARSPERDKKCKLGRADLCENNWRPPGSSYKNRHCAAGRRPETGASAALARAPALCARNSSAARSMAAGRNLCAPASSTAGAAAAAASTMNDDGLLLCNKRRPGKQLQTPFAFCIHLHARRRLVWGAQKASCSRTRRPNRFAISEESVRASEWEREREREREKERE